MIFYVFSTILVCVKLASSLSVSSKNLSLKSLSLLLSNLLENSTFSNFYCIISSKSDDVLKTYLVYAIIFYTQLVIFNAIESVANACYLHF